MGRRPVSYCLGGAQGARELGSVRCGWHTWAILAVHMSSWAILDIPKGAMLSRKAVNAEAAQRSLGREISGVNRQLEAVDSASVATGHQEIDGGTTMLQQHPSGRGPDSSSFLLSKLCIFFRSLRHPLLCHPSMDVHTTGTFHLSPKEEIQLEKQQQHDHN